MSPPNAPPQPDAGPTSTHEKQGDVIDQEEWMKELQQPTPKEAGRTVEAVHDAPKTTDAGHSAEEGRHEEYHTQLRMA
jgi:hypothetical protein